MPTAGAARLREGSLFSGYNGLGLAVSQVFRSEPAWFSEYEPPTKKNPRPAQGAAKILAHHWPHVPNHGDITAIDWAAVEPVDIITTGFPCTDLSLAGLGAGLRPGTRSGLWTYAATAIAHLRPRYVVIENVRGLLSAQAHSDVEPCPWCLGDRPGQPAVRALGAVLADLADLGYDARWCGLRAADVGAPHGRYRIFILATDTRSGGQLWRPDLQPGGRGALVGSEAGDHLVDPGGGTAADARGEHGDKRWFSGPGEAAGGRALGQLARRGRAPAAHAEDDRREPLVSGRPPAQRPGPTGDHRSPADAQGAARRGTEPDDLGTRPFAAAEPRERLGAPANASGERWGEGWTEPARLVGRPDAAQRGAGAAAWGQYAPAIQRWERILGRLAPAPTEPGPKRGQRLAPRFVEWLMGLPAGHVTDVPGVNRNAQLKALGNGVVPQQAVAALHHLRTDHRCTTTAASDRATAA